MKWVANSVLIVGVPAMIQGAVGFFLRFNLISWQRYGPSLAPVNFIFAGIGICVVAFAVKAIAGKKRRQEAGQDDRG